MKVFISETSYSDLFLKISICFAWKISTIYGKYQLFVGNINFFLHKISTCVWKAHYIGNRPKGLKMEKDRDREEKREEEKYR